MKKVHALLLASASIVGFCHGTAFAGPVITDWAYNLDAVFNTTTSAPTFSSGGGCQSVGSTMISWGSCTGVSSPAVNPNRSGVAISDTPSSGSVQTNGPAVQTNTYTHFNSGSIGGGAATLQTAVVESTLTLTSLSPVGGTNFGPATLSYGIKFLETTNSAPCVVASARPCDDIFVFQGVLNNQLLLDGNVYFISFFETTNALKPLPSAACLAAGAGSSCLGFTTPENAETDFNFSFTITSEPVSVVPEPASAALFGVGLIAAGWMRRRTKTRV